MLSCRLLQAVVAVGAFPQLIIAYGVPHRRAIECSFFQTADGGENCLTFTQNWGVSVEDFQALNPGVDCTHLEPKPYCLIGHITTDLPTTTTSSINPTTTETINPHSPTQSGLAANCDQFYKVNAGDQCNIIEGSYGISHDQFIKWNPAINSGCSNLQPDYYVCVHVPGAATPTTTKAPGSTCYPNAPDPIQPGAICGCDKWHQVKDETTTCDGIIKYDNINADDFFRWNTNIGGRACTGLWKGYWVCVHGPGATKPSTTTKKPESTCHPKAPEPVQPGAVCTCDGWHQVKDATTTCDGIIKYENIYADDFYKWNPNIGGKSCNGLWKGYWVCTHVPGAKRPPTQPVCYANAPQPVQPGAECNCKKWHYVKDASTTCDAIIKYEKISADNFYKWNPKVGGKACTGLWKGYNVCVGV